MKTSKILVTCPKGIAPCLAQEIKDLGFAGPQESIAGVSVSGSITDTLRLNLHLRTGHHVLYRLKDFTCENPEQLYKEIYEIAWEEIIDKSGYVSVASSVDNPTIKNWQFANLKCKDAIVDRIYKAEGKRPDSGPLTDKTVIFLYWKYNSCSVYIDTSGESLAKRGYRRIPLDAPMQETLAAAVVLAANYHGDTNFINPMCGSGTLAIEAGLIALGKAPGLTRQNYGFMHLKGYNDAKWENLRKEARGKIQKTIGKKIIAGDINPEAIEAARINSRLAGVEKYIDFVVGDYRQTPLPNDKNIIMFNPGYGIRLQEAKKLELTYKEIGDFLKQKCAGSTGYIFSGNLSLLKKVGLKAGRKMIFFNGPIECRLCEYEIYQNASQ